MCIRDRYDYRLNWTKQSPVTVTISKKIYAFLFGQIAFVQTKMSKIRENITGGDTAYMLHIHPFWINPQFVWVSDCCYAYCNNFCDWWI